MSFVGKDETMSIVNIPGAVYKCMMFYYYSHHVNTDASNVMGDLTVSKAISSGSPTEITKITFENPEWTLFQYNITDPGQAITVSLQDFSCFFFTSVLSFKHCSSEITIIISFIKFRFHSMVMQKTFTPITQLTISNFIQSTVQTL